ncbi:MAG: hypothetical protein CMI53_03730 [Parcubacteria group bacterium]|jgi:dolichol kinase|nr:hypothetical protein [Parcubacteria group bacterium]|tara:strand:- start:11001 stop:11558 length:558 start_codon:yes stop_codon:yes gene_type:complete
MTKEGKRQFVHIALFLVAFLLKYLTKFQAGTLLLVLFAITLYIIPHLRFRSYFYRSFEKKYSQGAVLYFLVLFVLVLIFPLPIVAVSWAVLALGDGSATLVGRHFRARELPWNREKTYAGSLAFIIFGTLGAFILLRWMTPELDNTFSIALKTAIVAAIAESFHWQINDNATVAVTSAVVLSFLI